MKTRFPLFLTAGFIAAAAAAVALAPVARAGDPVDDKVNAFKEYLKTNPDSQGIRNQIADLALAKSEKVVEPLLGVIRNPKYDDDVKVAALQAVGKQNVKTVAATLMGMADGKPWKEKPKLIAAAYEGAGDADADGQYKELIKVARKFLDTNGEIASSAFRAASLHVTRDSVDDFIKALESSDAALQQNAASKRPHHDACKPVIMDCLKKMTGKTMNDVKAWVDWWKTADKTFAPPTPGKDKPKDINASDVFTDDGYGFEIKKPNKAWSFRPGDGRSMVVRLEALEEGSPAAWVDVFVEGTKNLKSKTPEAFGKEIRDTLEPKFRTLKEAEWDKKCTYAGLKGIEHVLNGQHKDLDAIHMHNVFVDKAGIMFYMSGVFKSGKKASLETDLEEILKSFKPTR
jgi:hypothetical protein